VVRYVLTCGQSLSLFFFVFSLICGVGVVRYVLTCGQSLSLFFFVFCLICVVGVASFSLVCDVFLLVVKAGRQRSAVASFSRSFSRQKAFSIGLALPIALLVAQAQQGLRMKLFEMFGNPQNKNNNFFYK
jgi:hypothetical protein